MADARAGCRHRADVVVICVNAVNGNQAVVEKAAAAETFDRTLAVVAQTVGDFARCFIHVHVNRNAVAV